jgi:hypothetical protein
MLMPPAQLARLAAVRKGGRSPQPRYATLPTAFVQLKPYGYLTDNFSYTHTAGR